MSEEQERHTGGQDDGADGAAPPQGDHSLRLGQLEAENAELRRKSQRDSVEAGRLRKANETIKAQADEIERLNSVIAQGGGGGGPAADQSLAELLGEDTAKAVTAAARQEAQRHVAPVREELGRFAAHGEAQRRRDLEARVEARFPGLLRMVNDGGDNQAAWERFKAERPNIHNAWNYAAATGSCTDLFEYLQRFYGELGVSPPEEAGADTRTFPRMGGAADPGGRTSQKKVFTKSEVGALLEQARKDHADGVLTLKELQGIRAGVDAAYDEGRVIPG